MQGRNCVSKDYVLCHSALKISDFGIHALALSQCGENLESLSLKGEIVLLFLLELSLRMIEETDSCTCALQILRS